MEQYLLQQGAYPAHVPRRGTGHVESQVIPGLRLFIPDIFIAEDELRPSTGPGFGVASGA